jgi:hypothetical protein
MSAAAGPSYGSENILSLHSWRESSIESVQENEAEEEEGTCAELDPA